MTSSDWEIADTIARELVDRETDINEFQKAISYARLQSATSGGKVGEKFFALLETMVRDGRHLVRSGRTMDYYRDLQSVCNQHLKSYRTAAGENGRKLVRILGWSARLMRYYNTEAGEAEFVARQQATKKEPPHLKPQKPLSAPATQTTVSFSDLLERQSASPAKTSNETKRETVKLLTAVKNGKAQVRTEQGEEINCTSLPAYPPAKAGDTCRAEITKENGKAIKCVFKAWS